MFTPRPGPSVNMATAGPRPEERLATEAGAANAVNIVTSCLRLNCQALIASFFYAQRLILMIIKVLHLFEFSNDLCSKFYPVTAKVQIF